MTVLSERKILIVRFAQLGDVLLSTGPLAYYGQKHGLLFDFLTSASWASLLEGQSCIKRIIPCEKQDMSGKNLFLFLRSLAREYSREDILLDLHGNIRSHILRFFWPGKIFSYDKMSLERRLFIKSKGRLFKEKLNNSSVPQRYSLAFEKTLAELGLESELKKNSLAINIENFRGNFAQSDRSALLYPQESLIPPNIILTNQEIEEAAFRLGALGLAGKSPVAIHPFAAHETKTWSYEKWKELIKVLEAENFPWISIGLGKSPFAVAANSFINKSTLRQSAALLSQCRAIVTGDSGPMHLARSVNCKVVALFGPTRKEWGFYPTEREAVILEKDLDCRPCSLHGLGNCPINQRCLNSISALEVFEALKNLSKKN